MNTRVGCVPYLNAVPLVAKMPKEVQVHYAVPSKLPALLRSGEAQAILVSSIEALRFPNARICAGVGISSRSAVQSVRLFSRVPFREIRSLARDQSSMTSNALAQILLAELYGVTPRFADLPPDLDRMLADNDACLLIGDNGMRADGSGLHVLDLGEAWQRLTGLPFVWAVWLGGEGLTPDLAAKLNQAKQDGTSDIEALIPEASARFSFSPEATREYLCRTMDYDLGTEHLLALEQYGKRCVSHGLLPSFTMPECVGEVTTAR